MRRCGARPWRSAPRGPRRRRGPRHVRGLPLPRPPSGSPPLAAPGQWTTLAPDTRLYTTAAPAVPEPHRLRRCRGSGVAEGAAMIGAQDGRERLRRTGGRPGRWRDRRTDPAWLLLPQRLFLGVTFAYAGLDKLADGTFFDPAAATSIDAQIAAVRDTSPLGPLLGVAAGYATAVGVLIALGEIAVGVATLLGVRVRLAAAGGALISLSLLLTVT